MRIAVLQRERREIQNEVASRDGTEHFLLPLGRDTLDEDGQGALPGGQLVAGHALGGQDVQQQTAKVL